jgi:putative hemolysin
VSLLDRVGQQAMRIAAIAHQAMQAVQPMAQALQPAMQFVNPRSDMRRGEAVAQFYCTECGGKTAIVENHRGRLVVLAGRRNRYVRMSAVRCPDHGPLEASWERLEGKLAGTTRRPVKIKARPRSTP